MGWIAAGCCTLIAGYVLYKYFVQENVAKDEKPPTKLSHAPVPDIPVENQTEDRDPAPKLGHDEPPADEPISFKVPSLLVKLSKAESDIPTTQEVEKPSPKPETPQISKPAPPPSPVLDRSSSPPRLKPPTFGSMPMSVPARPGSGYVRPPPSAAASFRAPTKVLPNASAAPTSSIMPPGKQVSRKVILEPGHSPLDWAALTSNSKSRLRGKDAPGNLIRVTPSRLKQQDGRKGRDAWTVYHGKVYNITPYVPFHPGGPGEIMRGAGKDAVKLFMEVHPWVNWDGMLGECLVGILVSEEEETADKSSGLDRMD
ncbi:uncharacterized protein Z518_05024 [Rhinocladiella mackenziei CBS 650.93]|uniref:Cytochrome b5 heme-binding domain-containing protein n=1 Tax=Rhinocladiella mackenziei CBS 650.93 TaxID=1442369 RepID=A0A0D2FXN2_9EURO|nr:uncharacterized protein Z518_05024 [Rhinocladiella mackenziei CBS 650.93]KIX07047.1 hypothetical protein Z518_05024 [Rhinocladiella mackenziei CBS 650.93]